MSIPESQVLVDPYLDRRYRHFSHRWDRSTEQHPRNCLETPPALVERIREQLGGIDLDPCTTALNPCVAARFYTPDDDGILQAWDAERIFVNPPYGRTVDLWATKAALAAQGGARVVLLVPAHTSSTWFQRMMGTGAVTELLFIKLRLRFLKPEDRQPTWNAPFASVLVGMNVVFDRMGDLGFRR